MALVQITAVLRFSRRVRKGSAGPAWLTAQIQEIGASLNVRAPRLWVMPQLASPVLWCLGRQSCSAPEALVERLSKECWRGIVAHELRTCVGEITGSPDWSSWPAWLVVEPHLLVREAPATPEADLACDAWVVWALPESRRTYAETLIDVCAQVAKPFTPLPSLGVSDSAGRLFERRLTMILRDRVPRRVPRAGLLAIGVLGLMTLPGWFQSETDEPARTQAAGAAPALTTSAPQVAAEAQEPVAAEGVTSAAPRLAGQVESRTALATRFRRSRENLKHIAIALQNYQKLTATCPPPRSAAATASRS